MAAPEGMQQFDTAYDRLIMGRGFVEYSDYYTFSRDRYRQTLALVASLGLAPGARHLDIGGGQMALLGRDLLGFVPSVGDVVPTAASDVIALGVGFERINLMDAEIDVADRYDLITLCEVIEHIPMPPYVTFRKLARILKPGGWLVLTTPNGFRIRNILRMLANREVLDIYRYPDGDEPLGHQHEYTLRQMDWQLHEGGFAPATLRHYVSGWRGASPGARFAHHLTRPFNLIPHLRDGLIAAARSRTEAQTLSEAVAFDPSNANPKE